ncbi:YheC/YheD family endospore coat-associated protein [Brevibacillus migulae]|uniref:YheC/YheD family endospore coat-associated protein n=1 Tax=Brevibacillus migulae TaxID=1644114 RepID=UPI00106F083F|nr:YheC/YheD family protein [Brevibacillus migulae]
MNRALRAFRFRFHQDPRCTHISLSNETYRQLNIRSNWMILRFGAWQKAVPIRRVSSMPRGKILLPRKLTNKIIIPDLPYEYRRKGHQLTIGPVIGFQVWPKYYRNPRAQLPRFSHYHQIKGLVFLFTTRTIDRTSRTIRGYYYHPRKKRLIPGTFPYPSAIFNRTDMPRATYRHLTRHIGRRIFNYPYRHISKWTFWRKLSTQPGIKKHLPHTVSGNTVAALENMLSRYQDVYLKPTLLCSGQGIFRFKRIGHRYWVSDRYGRQAGSTSLRKLFAVIRPKLVKGQTYIVQRAIPFTVKGQKIDFRAYLQKGRSKQWRCTALETKVAKAGSIISNSANRVRIIPGGLALERYFYLTGEKKRRKIAEIKRICVRALRQLETRHNHFGDVALDFVLDKHRHVWLLEVNVNYAAEIKANRSRDERRVLPAILPAPFAYAKALAKS